MPHLSITKEKARRSSTPVLWKMPEHVLTTVTGWNGRLSVAIASRHPDATRRAFASFTRLHKNVGSCRAPWGGGRLVSSWTEIVSGK